MINIHVDKEMNGFIWNAEDWYKLRLEHHIIGNLIGTLPSAGKNAKITALPSQLLPEEITLLLEQNICKLVRAKDIINDVSCLALANEKYKKFMEDTKIEQIKSYKEEKESKVFSIIDQIVKNVQNSPRVKGKEILKDDILKRELAKIEPLQIDHILKQTFLEDPWLDHEDVDIKNWNYPQTNKEILKYKVFKDLWLKKYFITNGIKFAGDYLVYKGDPTGYHAQYIIICRDATEVFKVNELAMYGRVGSNTKKIIVFATLEEEEVKYYSISWTDIGMWNNETEVN